MRTTSGLGLHFTAAERWNRGRTSEGNAGGIFHVDSVLRSKAEAITRRRRLTYYNISSVMLKKNSGTTAGGRSAVEHEERGGESQQESEDEEDYGLYLLHDKQRSR